MQRREHRAPGGAGQVEYQQLVPRVEVVGGFVEHQHLRLGGQGAGEQHPLTLAAGQGDQRPIQQSKTFRTLGRPMHGGPVGFGESAEGAQMGGAAEGDQLGCGETRAGGVVLGEYADPAGSGARGERGDRGIAEQGAPGGRADHAVEGAEQGRLAAAVQADDRAEAATVDLPGDLPQHRAAAPGGIDPVEADGGHRGSTTWRRIASTKAGTPTTAVRMPIGTSVGASTVRAAVSAQTSSRAPSSAAQGTSRR